MTPWLRWQVESRNPSAPPLDVQALQWALPAIDEAAAEVVGVLSRLNDHIGGQIAGAAALAGAALRRNDDVDAAGVRLFQFADLMAGNVGWKRRRLWSPRLPPQFEPSYDTATLLGKLQAPFDAVCAEYPIRPPYQPYVALLAALRVLAWAHEQGAIEQTAGRDLIARYVVAGSRAEPRAAAPLEPLPEREPPSSTIAGPITVAEDEAAIVNVALPSRGYPSAIALTDRAVYVLAVDRWSFRPWFVRRVPLDVVERVTLRRSKPAATLTMAALLILFGLTLTAIMLAEEGERSIVPYVIVVAGALLPFAARGRRTLHVHFANRKTFVWRPPLTLSRGVRAKNDVLARLLADAFRAARVPVSE